MSKVEIPRNILSRLIRYDHGKAFTEFLMTRHDSHEQTFTNGVLMPSTKEMLLSMCSHRAEVCLDALLYKEIDLINVPLEGGLYRLHIAAQSLRSLATETCLRYSAKTDVPCDDIANFPLSVALNAIRNNTCASEWNPKISILKLLYIFCLPELKEPLETVKLLASKTQELEKISSRFLLQGEVVQLAALLLVAWDKLVQPFSDQGIKGCPIGQLILNELQHHQENHVSQSGNSSIKIHDHEANLENAWKVLEILDIARDTIEEWRLSEVAEEIAPHLVPVHVAYQLWEKHKIYLEPEDRFADDVKCLRPRLTPKQKAWLYRSIDKRIRSVSTFPKLSEDIQPHLVPVHVAYKLCDKHQIYLEPEDRFADDVKCLRPRHTPQQEAWLFRSIDKRIQSVSTIPKLSKRRTIKGAGSSHSFHTSSSNLNLVKPCKSQPSAACHKPGTGFSNFIRSPRIPHLISALKRM